MTPEEFVALTELPLNPNGKVNRRALPAPAAIATREFIAPRTEMEAAVAAVWGAILKLDRIGADDNFFDLGGHSLLAAQAAGRLRAALDLEVSVRAIFEKRTLADLARHLEVEQERAAPDREELLL
jgi:acyl carrier protein